MFEYNTVDSLSKTDIAPISKAVLYHILKGFLPKSRYDNRTSSLACKFCHSATNYKIVLNFTPKDRTASEHA